MEFGTRARQDVEQAFSYAVAEGAKYVWTSTGTKNEYYEVPSEKPKARRTVADIPRFGATGKPTKVNELDEIGVALADFIKKEAEA